MTVVAVVIKQHCTPKNKTYIKSTYPCDSSYCRDSSASGDSSDSSGSSDTNDSSDSSDQTTLYTKKLNLSEWLKKITQPLHKKNHATSKKKWGNEWKSHATTPHKNSCNLSTKRNLSIQKKLPLHQKNHATSQKITQSLNNKNHATSEKFIQPKKKSCNLSTKKSRNLVIKWVREKNATSPPENIT